MRAWFGVAAAKAPVTILPGSNGSELYLEASLLYHMDMYIILIYMVQGCADRLLCLVSATDYP